MIKNMFETYLNKNYEFNWNLKSRDKIYIYQEADGDAENQQLSKTFVLAFFCFYCHQHHERLNSKKEWIVEKGSNTNKSLLSVFFFCWAFQLQKTWIDANPKYWSLAFEHST